MQVDIKQQRLKSVWFVVMRVCARPAVHSDGAFTVSLRTENTIITLYLCSPAALNLPYKKWFRCCIHRNHPFMFYTSLRPVVSLVAQCGAGQKGVCVSGSNWDELALMGLYGIFEVISVWGLLWRAGSSEIWLGPLPSAALLSFILVLSHPPSLSPVHTRSLSLLWERANECLCFLPFHFPLSTVI